MHYAHDAYLESRVMTAGPIDLIRLLYQSGMGEVREARTQLAEGNIEARVKHISKACAILVELAASLDHERGGEVSQRLASLYDYMVRKLVEANIRKSDAILAEVLGLMATLLEGWDGVKAQTQPERPAENQWMPAMGEPETAHSSNAWSF